MEIAVFVIIGSILIAFAAVAVIASVVGVRHITLEEPAEGSPKLGRIAGFQEKLAILNSK